MTKKIGFIGCGKIADPMVRYLVRRFPDCEIRVTARSEAVSSVLAAEFPQVRIASAQDVLDHAGDIILSVLARTAREILPGLEFRAGQRIISVMADIELAEVSRLIAPATDPCVTIPLPFIHRGGCPLPVYPESPALTELFGDGNPVIVQSEEAHMGPHFAATAILSTVMAALDCTSRWLAGYTGDDRAAETYVASLVGGYLGSLEKDGKQRFREALGDLSTEGGLNFQLLNHNRDGGMFEVLEQGLRGLGARVAPDPAGVDSE